MALYREPSLSLWSIFKIILSRDSQRAGNQFQGNTFQGKTNRLLDTFIINLN